MSDMERELRETLAEHARRAPAAEGLAERIIAEAQLEGSAHEPRPARSRWRAWSLPAIAAACVAGVVASIALVAGLQHPKTHSANTPAVHTTPRTSAAATSPPPARSTAPSSSQAASSAPTSTGPGVGAVPIAFRVADLTFVSPNDGWALGSGRCFKTPAKRCTALLRTSDGENWASITMPAANVPIDGNCADPCIQHIRFANEDVGYAYAQNALFMTTDGGAHWTRQKGGADALETLSGNVIRVTDSGNCPPGCSFQVLTAPVGSTQWQAARLAGSPTGDSVLLDRTGHDAYLLIGQNPAGGAGSAKPTLFASSDDGLSWSNKSTPCPQDAGHKGEIDANFMTTAEDGSVAVVCAARLGMSSGQFTATSHNGDTPFPPGSAGAFKGMVSALGAASGSVLLVSADDTYRSADGGQSWRPLGSNGPGRVTWIGFENGSVGRAISADSRMIWTTTDAGQTWQAHPFQ